MGLLWDLLENHLLLQLLILLKDFIVLIPHLLEYSFLKHLPQLAELLPKLFLLESSLVEFLSLRQFSPEPVILGLQLFYFGVSLLQPELQFLTKIFVVSVRVLIHSRPVLDFTGPLSKTKGRYCLL